MNTMQKYCIFFTIQSLRHDKICLKRNIPILFP